jgi:hypothetical protein
MVSCEKVHGVLAAISISVICLSECNSRWAIECDSVVSNIRVNPWRSPVSSEEHSVATSSECSVDETGSTLGISISYSCCIKELSLGCHLIESHVTNSIAASATFRVHFARVELSTQVTLSRICYGKCVLQECPFDGTIIVVFESLC